MTKSIHLHPMQKPVATQRFMLRFANSSTLAKRYACADQDGKTGGLLCDAEYEVAFLFGIESDKYGNYVGNNLLEDTDREAAVEISKALDTFSTDSGEEEKSNG